MIRSAFRAAVLAAAAPAALAAQAPACPAPPAGHARLGGLVRVDTSGAPVRGARVIVTWSGTAPGADTTATDGAGRYRFCAVPVGVGLALRADAGSSLTQLAGLSLGGATDAIHLEMQDPGPPFTGPVAFATVRGRLVGAGDGAPLAGVLLRADGREVTTDREGRFFFSRVPVGTLDATVSLGEATVPVRIPVERADTLRLTVRVPVPGKAVALDTLAVSAGGSSRAVEDARRSGQRRYVVPRERIERTMGGGQYMTSALRANLPGVSVRERRMPGSTAIAGITVSYAGRPVTVFLDVVRVSPEEVALVRPRQVRVMEFFPNANAAAGRFAGISGAVLVLWTLESLVPSS